MIVSGPASPQTVRYDRVPSIIPMGISRTFLVFVFNLTGLKGHAVVSVMKVNMLHPSSGSVQSGKGASVKAGISLAVLLLLNMFCEFVN